jgi:hypothetical protein
MTQHLLRCRNALCCCAGAVMLLAACGPIVPARTPPQLAHTPGPAVIVTETEYRGELFQARYPPGWQVVTSAAFSDVWVIFISPDETAVIVLATDPEDAEITPPAAPERIRRVEETIELGNGSGHDPDDFEVIAVLVAPQETWEAHHVAFQRVLATIEAAQG